MDKGRQLITQLIKKDSMRMQALECLLLLDLPDAYIAAGFVRNLVWDHLHDKTVSSSLNDVDVIYYDLNEDAPDKYRDYECALSTMMPTFKWQVRNQALMHSQNGDSPYKDSLDAMSYWPEKETAVAIRKLASGEFACIAAFGFESLLKLQLTHNPKREKTVFNQRIKSKNWFENWPKLVIAQ